MWFTILLLVAVQVVSYMMRPKPKVENARPAGLGDFRLPTATQNRVVPIVWGTVPIRGPNVVWFGDFKQKPLTRTIDGGLFKSDKTQIVAYGYHLGLQFAICRGPVDSLKSVKIGTREVFSGTQGEGSFSINFPNLFGGNDLGNGGVVGQFFFHVGSATQAPDSYLSGFQAIGGVTPRYKKTCYGVWQGGYLGNSTNIDPWEFEVRRVVNCNGLGLGTPGVNSNVDANPMNVAYEILTNSEWGFGFPASDVDVPNFQAAAATLLSEGNGFSMILDSPVLLLDLLNEVEKQIDGTFFVDLQTGKWKVKLARNDYDVDTVPQITDPSEVSNFSRGAWRDTTNVVRSEFDNRANLYEPDFALAHDMANAMIQGSGTVVTGVKVTASAKYPGVKNAALANQIAWRDLRALSYPLAKASIVVDRSFWDLTPWSVVAWTDSVRGFVKLPMRVQKINYGSLKDGKITLDLVQDVFQFQTGIYEDPPATNWTRQVDALAAFATNRQLAFEAPRALVNRDPRFPGLADRIYASARASGPASSFDVVERHAGGTPSGSYFAAGQIFGFALIGTLKNNLASGSAYPLSSFLITATPDSQADLQAAFVDTPTIETQGRLLYNLVMIGDEFMLVQSATNSGADVSLNDVYRGVLDSVQATHSLGAAVWLLFVGSGISDGVVPSGQNVDVKLLPRSVSDVVDVSAATAISFAMADRARRPYPPSRLSLNGTAFPTGTVSLDSIGGGDESTGALLALIRRDFRVVDEIADLTVDAATLFGDYPAANSTTHEVQVRNDPAGANTLLYTITGITSASQAILRLKILRYTDGAVPSTMRLVVAARHDYDALLTGLASRSSLTWDFNTASASLAGQHNFGARAANVASTVYTATQNGTYAFTLSSAFSAGDVEYRLNAGAWTTLISAGNTTGNILGVVATDTIEIRHTSGDSNALKQIDMAAPGGGQNAYGVFYT